MPEQKDDLITKRVNDAGKVFGWIKENPLAFLCLCLTVIAGVFIYLFIDAKNENIALTIDLSKQIQDEIRLQAAPINRAVFLRVVSTGGLTGAFLMFVVLNMCL